MEIGTNIRPTSDSQAIHWGLGRAQGSHDWLEKGVRVEVLNMCTCWVLLARDGLDWYFRCLRVLVREPFQRSVDLIRLGVLKQVPGESPSATLTIFDSGSVLTSRLLCGT